MPSNAILEQKKQIVNALVERFNNSAAGVFVTYSGLTVEKDTELRTKLREAGVEYTVVKNTLTRFAVNEVGYPEFSDILNGTTALATSKDVVAPAKITFDGESKYKVMKAKAGFIEGKVMNYNEVKAIASIPSKDVLVAQLLGLLLNPIRSLAVVLDQAAKKNA